jgi:hypothetical protein
MLERPLPPPLRLIAIFILISCAALPAGAFVLPLASSGDADAFNIFIVRPAEGSISDNDLSIVATVTSTFELSSVKAQVEGREVSLAFSSNAVCSDTGVCSPGWAGVLPLAGLARGAKTLTVTATDVFGGAGQSQRHFTYDQPPRVSVAAPVAETVTGLTLHVKADCADDDTAGCKTMTVAYAHPSSAPGTSGVVLSVAGSSIDQDVTLPSTIKDFSSDGEMLFLKITGTDSASQSATVSRTIYVQQHSRLVEVESFNGRILDAQPDRVLLLENAGRTDNVLKIRTRSTGDESIIPLAGKIVIVGFLSPKGAVFSATDATTFSSNGRAYDWRDGTLVALDEVFSGLKVRGDYALWDTFDHATSSTSLRLRNLVSGTTTVVAKTDGGNSADLAANGDVIYLLSNGRDQQGHDLINVYRYRNGASVQLTNDAQDFANAQPVTDGINVVYQRQPRSSQTNDHTLTLIDPAGGRPDLSTMPRSISLGEYQAAGGWVAFPKMGGGVSQVWTRSPAGDLQQISFFGTDSFLSRLGSDGESTFTSRSAPTLGASIRLYLHRAGAPPLDVAAASPNTFSLGGQWYAFLGRTLFRLPTTAEVSPVLLTDGDDNARAVALDSVTHTRDPFAFSTTNNFSADRRTRVLLFARNVDWLSVNANTPVTAQAEDAAHHTFPLAVEYAAPDPNMNWMADIVVRLPDELSGGGAVSLTINVGGFNSNQVKLVIASPGGGTP